MDQVHLSSLPSYTLRPTMDLPSLRSSLPFSGPMDFSRESANAIGNKLSGVPKFQIQPAGTKNALPEATLVEGKAELNATSPPKSDELRKAFQDFVGQTLFSQMIGSMRATTQGAAYFNGGQAEKIFQGQLDQLLSEKLSEASAAKISDPMFKLFQ